MFKPSSQKPQRFANSKYANQSSQSRTINSTPIQNILITGSIAGMAIGMTIMPGRHDVLGFGIAAVGFVGFVAWVFQNSID